jgi:hypothetical protein
MSLDAAEHGYGQDLRRRLRRRLILLCVAVGVATVSAGGLWWARKAMTANVPPGEAPLLRADGRPFKIRPPDPGGMTVPNVGRAIYEQGKDKVEHLLPPPEEPLPRAALPQPAPEPPPQPVAAAPAPEPPPAAAPPPPVTAAPLAPAAAPAAPPKPAPAEPQAAAPTKPAPPGAVRVQVGAVHSEGAAKAEWDRLRKQNADLLGQLGLTVSRVEDRRGTFFRIQAGPVESAQAERICGELKRRHVGCIVVR